MGDRTVLGLADHSPQEVGLSEEWLEELVTWLREQGVERILVRLDKGFFRITMIEKLKELKVDFVMKMQESNTLQKYKGPFVRAEEDPRLEVAEGRRWGVRMLSVRESEKPEGELENSEI